MIMLTFCILFVVVAVVIIASHRCVYELYVAHDLKIRVKLFPAISDSALKGGWLNNDACIDSINNRVDSENAECSIEADKIAIHDAIKSGTSDGFHEMNMVAEGNKLDYLLDDFPAEEITGYDSDSIESSSRNSETEKKKRRKYAVELYLVPSIMTMLEVVHSITADEIPDFETFKTQSESSEPIEVFLEWRKVVKFVIEEKIQSA